jgi:phosphoglycolate phosphatase-like HAD superfamily hydrolase
MRSVACAVTIVLVALLSSAVSAADPLPSWNDGPKKQAILNLVAKVTREDSSDFVPKPERIATFDNDGTLWCEQPVYFQALFAFDRIKALAPQHPDWKEKEPFKSILSDNRRGLADGGEKLLLEVVAVTHSGMTTVEFNDIVRAWLRTARHPRFDVPYTRCVYQPMLELLAYLRANDFKTFIVSGGGVEFMRNFADQTYGIPPEQVIGTTGVVEFEMRDGRPVLVRLPKLRFVDDGPGKPVGINTAIGRRPVMAFGNSDGDLEMLQYTTGGDGPRFGLLVHHTDGVREYAYDNPSLVGQLDKALAAAPKNGWTVVSMKTDWKVIFPFELDKNAGTK